jgi:hypothetical protein
MFVNLVLLFFALSFLVFGVWGLVAPASLAALMHFSLDAPGAHTEIRAFDRALAPGVLLTLTVVTLGVALARSAGLVLDRSASRLMLGVLAWEASGVVLGAMAYLRVA